MKKEENIVPYIYPNPALLISSKYKDKESILTLSWVGTGASNPPTVIIGVRPTRYSYKLIRKSREFVINVPTVNLLEQVKFCGSNSGEDADKWRECNFTRSPAKEIKTPLIKECPANIECKVDEIIERGSHHLFIGRIVSLHLDQDWKEDNYPDMITYTRGIYKICNDFS